MLFDQIDAYTAPRLVACTCEDFYNDDETIDATRSAPPTASPTSSSGGCTISGGTDCSVDTSDNIYNTAHGVEISDEFSLEEEDAIFPEAWSCG